MRNSSLTLACTNDIYSKYGIDINAIKRYASQFYVLFSILALKFTSGTFNGLTTIIIAKSYEEGSEIKMTIDEVTWFSSHCFAFLLGFLTSGLLAQNIGSRKTMLIAAIIYITCCLSYHFSTNASMFLTVQAVIGINIPMSMVPSYTYVVEISEPHIRSILLFSGSIAVILGASSTILMAKFIHWRTIVLINILYPVIGLLAIYILPESPYWLANKGKLAEAEAALLWLRGWTTPNCVEKELKALKDNCKFANNHDAAHSVNVSFRKYVHDVLIRYSERTFYYPLALVFFIFFAHSCVGSYTLQSYNIVIFEMMDTAIDKYVASTIFELIRAIGVLLSMIVIHYTGKRKLMFFSLTTVSLSYLIIACTLDFKESHFGMSNVNLWVPVVMFYVSSLLSAIGFDKLVFVLNGELFPSKFRGIGVAIGLLMFSIFTAATNKAYLYVMYGLSLQGTFFLYATTSFIFALLLYFILPETEGKTLIEIEEYYRGAQSPKNKRSKFNENVVLP